MVTFPSAHVSGHFGGPEDCEAEMFSYGFAYVEPRNCIEGRCNDSELSTSVEFIPERKAISRKGGRFNSIWYFGVKGMLVGITKIFYWVPFFHDS
jgi:hypothetical protein